MCSCMRLLSFTWRRHEDAAIDADVFDLDVVPTPTNELRLAVDVPFLNGLATPAKMVVVRDGGGEGEGERV